MKTEQLTSEYDDPRFTMGLYIDVIAVLEKHGFVRAPDPAAHAGSLVELLHMVREFEGPKADIHSSEVNQGAK